MKALPQQRGRIRLGLAALAAIAASTIHPATGEAVVDAAEDATAPAVAVDEARDAAGAAAKKPRRKRGEGRARGDRGDRPEGGSPKTEKDLLLDSVLSALPEPKAPGQGRGRRRVTTAALSGTPVDATPVATEN